MANTKMRVVIPRKPEDVINLGIAINKKHTEDGATSPLSSLKDYSWTVEGPNLEKAKAKHDEAEELRKQMEKAYKERDLLMANVPAIIRASRDVLTGINRQNMKRLGDWGFIVDNTVETKKKPETKK
jgi:hypothetical protein